MFHKKYKLVDPNVGPDWIDAREWQQWDAPMNVVRGESHRRDALLRLCGPPNENGYLLPVVTTLLREPANPVDRSAIRVEIGGAHVGYIAQELANQLSPVLDKARCRTFAVAGVIRGGSVTAPSFGVHLWLDRRISPGPRIEFEEAVRQNPDFAVSWWYSELHESNRSAARAAPAKPGNEVAGLRTGGSAHGGKWSLLAEGETVKVISSLRAFLADEEDPLERHYAFNTLEEALYKCRDAFPSALGEFEEICHQHDQEMEVIRPALIEVFGGLPLLPTYKQIAIMKAKAGEPQAAAQWCKRGLEVYGDEALETEGTTDLCNRLEKLSRKLQ